MSEKSTDDETEVKEAMAQFYTALNTLFTGELASMREIWSHAEDVTYMGPDGGFQVGWDQVLADWEKQAAMKLGGEIRPEETMIQTGEDLAVVHNYERGENTNAAGKAEKFSIRVTNVFRKEGEKWKMIGHHADTLPYLEK